MKRRCVELISVSAVVVAVAVLLKMVSVPVSGQTPAAPAKAGGPAPTTIWGRTGLARYLDHGLPDTPAATCQVRRQGIFY